MTSTTHPASLISNDLPAGTWVADPVHSDVSFRVRHLGVGRVRGSFALSAATLTAGDDGLAGARVIATVDTASVHTGNEQRDQHVRSADFLDVASHPRMEFVSTGVHDLDGDTFVLVGQLTLHGVTQAVELATEFHGVGADPSGTARVGFSASTVISRAAFGIDIQLGFGAGNAVVADTVEIAIEIVFALGSAAR